MTLDEGRYKDKLKRREILDQTRAEASNSLDKYLLSFSTASIYLSLYFRKELVDVLIYKWLLTSSWIILLVCILTTLFSLKLSEKAHERQMKIIDEQIKGDSNNQENCWSIILGYINSVSILLFVVGIAFLTIFFIYNLK